MTRAFVIVAVLATAADAAPKAKKPPAPEQKEADRHFKAGVALFKESKFTEALAEFERANELAPHPLVLYNIAACHRELSNYAEAVKFYRRFLSEGAGTVAATRLHTAQTELDAILARIASVTIVVPDGTELTLDGKALGAMPIDMPLILSPGEHHIAAKAAGHKDVERKLRVASGDEVSITLDMPVAEEPAKPPPVEPVVKPPAPIVVAPAPKRIGLGAGFGTNLKSVSDTGAPSLGLAVALGSRFELGVEATLVAYAVIPSVRVRLAGDALSVHIVGAAPIAIDVGAMSQTFVAGAGGLGVRYRPMPALAFRLESFVSVAGGGHGTTFPAFFGGELWF
jgi:PEGA domain